MAGVPTPYPRPTPALFTSPPCCLNIMLRPPLIDFIADFTTLDITVSRLFIGHKIV